MRNQALWVGRFQPPTIAHLATLETILRTWSKVLVGIIVRSTQTKATSEEWKDFVETTASSTMSQRKNPFDGDEVKRMWQASAKVRAISDRVSFYPMPQIGYQHGFAGNFPESEYDFVEVEYDTSISASDMLRKKTFERLLARKIYVVHPSFVLHNNEIRVLIANGRQWKEFIPEGAFEVFMSIRGPERLLRI